MNDQGEKQGPEAVVPLAGGVCMPVGGCATCPMLEVQKLILAELQALRRLTRGMPLVQGAY